MGKHFLESRFNGYLMILKQLRKRGIIFIESVIGQILDFGGINVEF